MCSWLLDTSRPSHFVIFSRVRHLSTGPPVRSSVSVVSTRACRFDIVSSRLEVPNCLTILQDFCPGHGMVESLAASSRTFPPSTVARGSQCSLFRQGASLHCGSCLHHGCVPKTVPFREPCDGTSLPRVRKQLPTCTNHRHTKLSSRTQTHTSETQSRSNLFGRGDARPLHYSHEKAHRSCAHRAIRCHGPAAFMNHMLALFIAASNTWATRTNDASCH